MLMRWRWLYASVTIARYMNQTTYWCTLWGTTDKLLVRQKPKKLGRNLTGKREYLHGGSLTKRCLMDLQWLLTVKDMGLHPQGYIYP